MRHLISPLDFTVEETYEVLDVADRIAANPIVCPPRLSIADSKESLVLVLGS